MFQKVKNKQIKKNREANKQDKNAAWMSLHNLIPKTLQHIRTKGNFY